MEMRKGWLLPLTAFTLSGLALIITVDAMAKTDAKTATASKIAVAIQSVKVADKKAAVAKQALAEKKAVTASQSTKSVAASSTTPAAQAGDTEEIADADFVPQGAKLVAGDPELNDFYVVGQTEATPQFQTLADQREQKTIAFIAAHPLPDADEIKTPFIDTRYAANVEQKVQAKVDWMADAMAFEIVPTEVEPHSESVMETHVALNTEEVKPLVLISHDIVPAATAVEEAEDDFLVSPLEPMIFPDQEDAFMQTHAIDQVMAQLQVGVPLNTVAALKLQPQLSMTTPVAPPVMKPAQSPLPSPSTKAAKSLVANFHPVVISQPKPMLAARLSDSPMIAALTVKLGRQDETVMADSGQAYYVHRDMPNLNTVLTKMVHQDRSPEYVTGILRQALRSTDTPVESHSRALVARQLHQAVKKDIASREAGSFQRVVNQVTHPKATATVKVAPVASSQPANSKKRQPVVVKAAAPKVAQLHAKHSTPRSTRLAHVVPVAKRQPKLAKQTSSSKVRVISMAEAEHALHQSGLKHSHPSLPGLAKAHHGSHIRTMSMAEAERAKQMALKSR